MQSYFSFVFLRMPFQVTDAVDVIEKNSLMSSLFLRYMKGVICDSMGIMAVVLSDCMFLSCHVRVSE